MSSLLTHDWRKVAAAAASAPAPGATPDDAIERAFLDQAFVAVANKAGQLMDPPHRLGFEIVSKNDENTRLLGVFAFRTGNELLYAPVFFLNGDIKGTDLIYRHKVKRFLPLNEQIIRRLISMTKLNDGVGVDRSYGRRQPQALQLERVAFPPPTYKKASDGKDVFDAAAFEAELSRQVAVPSAGLADFIQHKGGAHALEKLASIIERVPAFAAACDERLTKAMLGVSDAPFPADVTVETVLRGISKKASAAEKAAARDAAYRALIGANGANVKVAAAFFGEEQLILRTAEAAVFNKEASAEKRDKAAKRGYDLEDSRRDLKPAMADYTDDLRTLERPGIHKVMDSDGKLVRVRAFRDARKSLYSLCDRSDDSSSLKCCSPCGDYDSELPMNFLCVTDEAKARLSQTLRGPDTLVAEEDTVADVYDGLDELPTVGDGTAWLLVDKTTGELYDTPFAVTSKKEDDRGIIILSIRFRHGSTERLLRINPDAATFRDGVFGNSLRFIKAATKPKKESNGDSCCEDSSGSAFGELDTFNVVGRSDLLGDMRKSACQRGELFFQDGWFSAMCGERNSHRKHELPRGKAACALAARLEIPADNAEELLDLAEKRGSVKFWFHTDGKQAGAIRVLDEPIFQVDNDTDFNVDLQHPQNFTLRTSQYRDAVPPDRAGDHANLQPEKPRNVDQMENLPEDILLNAAPEEIAGIASELKIPKIFEVGVVGALASAYQSAAIVSSFMPKLEEAIDAIGRTLFLYYWKPEDFRKAYGEDDMPGLELELISQFKSLGDLWLKLSQTSPDKDPLASGLRI